MNVVALGALKREGDALFQTLHDEGAQNDRRSPLAADPDTQRVHAWAVRVADALEAPDLRERFFARGIAANPHVDRSTAQHELWDRLTQLNRILDGQA